MVRLGERLPFSKGNGYTFLIAAHGVQASRTLSTMIRGFGKMKARTIKAAVFVASAAFLGAFVAAPEAMPATPDPRPDTYAPTAMPTGPAVPIHDVTRTPILLLVGPEIDPRWDVASAAHAWNVAVGCELFQTYPDDDWHETWRVLEVEDLKAQGYETPGLADPDTLTVSLNPEFVGVEGVAIHEVGHLVYGSDHHDSTTGVMSGHFIADRSAITEAEADQARDLNVSRCER